MFFLRSLLGKQVPQLDVSWQLAKEASAHSPRLRESKFQPSRGADNTGGKSCKVTAWHNLCWMLRPREEMTHCIALHCIALHCIALHCIALQAHQLQRGVASEQPTCRSDITFADTGVTSWGNDPVHCNAFRTRPFRRTRTRTQTRTWART
jgi:hypothetical protein